MPSAESTEIYAERRRAAMHAARMELEAIRGDQIIAGFATAVAEKGYAATTITDIARAARVSKTTIYEHFKDKDAIYLALHEKVANRLMSELEAVFSDPAVAVLPWQQSVAQAIGRYLETMASEPGFLTQVLIESTNSTPAMAKAREQAKERFATMVVGLSEQLAAESDEAVPMARDMAYAFLGGFLALLQRAAAIGPDAVRALGPPLNELVVRMVVPLPWAGR